jgi:hypothetical protein
MHRLFVYGLLMSALYVLGLQAQAIADTTTAPPAVAFAAGEGVEVIIRSVDHSAAQLYVEIRGPNITGLPRDFPVVVRFDTNIVRMTPIETSAGLVVDSANATQTATWFLTRSPFLPPTAWHYTVLIALDRLPTHGQIAVGTDAVHQVNYHAAPARTPATHSPAKPST